MILLLQDFPGEWWKLYTDPYPRGCRVGLLHQERNPAASCIDKKEVDPFFFTLSSLTFTALMAKAGPGHFPASSCRDGWWRVISSGAENSSGRVHFRVFPQTALMLSPMAPSQYSDNIQADTELVKVLQQLWQELRFALCKFSALLWELTAGEGSFPLVSEDTLDSEHLKSSMKWGWSC